MVYGPEGSARGVPSMAPAETPVAQPTPNDSHPATSWFALFAISLLLALFFGCAGMVLDSRLAEAEATQDRVRLNVLFAMLYSAFGRNGAVLAFFIPGALAVLGMIAGGVGALIMLLAHGLPKRPARDKKAGKPKNER